MNKIFKSTLLLAVLITTTSCGPSKKDSLINICQSDPELCSDLHKISNCRYKRTDLIRARYYDKIQPSKEHTIDLLDELDAYESCIELTLFMQFTRNKERKKQRIENYFMTQKLMKDRLKTIKGTQDPHLAYYLWTRYQDLNAKTVFLNAADQKDIKDVKLLIKLATLYAKEDPQQSLDLFYKALQETKSIDVLPKNAFTSIMTIFYQNKEFEQAYIWALLAKEQNAEEELPINLDLILQKGLTNGKKLISNEDVLEDKADAYHKQLTKGTFNLQAPQLIL